MKKGQLLIAVSMFLLFGSQVTTQPTYAMEAAPSTIEKETNLEKFKQIRSDHHRKRHHRRRAIKRHYRQHHRYLLKHQHRRNHRPRVLISR